MSVTRSTIENLTSGRPFKMYLVEMDDDNRERVISAVVQYGGIELDTDSYETSLYDGMVIKGWDIPTGATITLKAIMQNGSLFKIENFSTEEEE